MQAAYLTQDTNAKADQTITQNGQTITIKPVSNGTQTVTITKVVAKGQSAGLNNQDQLPCSVKSDALKDMGEKPGDYTLTFTYTTSGEGTSVELTSATK